MSEQPRSPEELGLPEKAEPPYEGRKDSLKVRILNWLADFGPIVDNISVKRAKELIEKSKVADYLKEGGTYLDIGTGIGHIVEQFVHGEKKVNFLALDPLWKRSSHVGDRLEEQSEATGDAPNALFMKAVGEHLPVRDNAVDGVTIFFVLHHVPPQYEKGILGEIRRVLKDDGMLFLVEDTPEDAEAVERNSKWCKRLNMESSEDRHFYRNRDEWRAFAESEGFELVDEAEFSSEGRKSEGTIKHGSFILRKKRMPGEEQNPA
jgi:ubiquinone/menaquinone biosynthesis C-methylase UbiE